MGLARYGEGIPWSAAMAEECGGRLGGLLTLDAVGAATESFERL